MKEQKQVKKAGGLNHAFKNAWKNMNKDGLKKEVERLNRMEKKTKEKLERLRKNEGIYWAEQSQKTKEKASKQLRKKLSGIRKNKNFVEKCIEEN